jgi:hypothetical protein
MTDHHYERTLTSRPAGSRRHVGLILAGAAILAAAVLAWAFSRQQVDSPLPQPAHARVQPPPAPAAAAPTESFAAPPPIRQSAAPVVAQPPTAPGPAAAAMPTSEDVAAVGDTRSVQP